MSDIENRAAKEEAAANLLKLMFPGSYTPRWSIDVYPYGIVYCDGLHEKGEHCDEELITISEEQSRIYRHKTRGSRYKVLHAGKVQVAPGTVIKDNDTILTYIGLDDGGLVWHRLPDEFHDGRFEIVKAASPDYKVEGTFLSRLLDQTEKRAKDDELSAAYNGSYQGGRNASAKLEFVALVRQAAVLDRSMKIAEPPKSSDALRELKVQAIFDIYRHSINPLQTVEGMTVKQRKDLFKLYGDYVDVIEHIDNSYTFVKTNIRREYPDDVFEKMVAEVRYAIKRSDNLDEGEDLETVMENAVSRILALASKFSGVTPNDQ